MASKDTIYRPQQSGYCLIALAFTLVIFGILYSIEQGAAVALFAASISLTGIPFWLMLKKQERFRSGVAPLWGIHAGVNLSAVIIAHIMSEYASESVNFLAVCFGLGLIVFHIGLLARATIVARRQREMVDKFALMALYLCPLLLAIGILFFDT